MTRQPSLDVARGLLAWSVVCVHCSWLSGWLRHETGPVGVWAVIGFVTMSGYVITRLLLRRKEPYRDFITRRFMRLFPAFLACLALALILRPCTVGNAPTEALREASEHTYYPWHLLAHLTLLHGIVPSTILPLSPMTLLPPGWSVSLEWQLYLIAPIALHLLVSFGRPAAVIGTLTSALLAVPPLSNWISRDWGFIGAFVPQRFVFFLIGMLVAIYPLKLPAVRIHWPSALVYLGQISYSSYLCHWPILAGLDTLLAPAQLPSDLHAVILFLAGTPLILVASIFLFDWVEQPGIKFGNELIRRRREKIMKESPLLN